MPTRTDPQRLADLIRQRNEIGREIAALIGRPATIGHVGEFIAAAVFDIELEESASGRGIDGHFRSGPLAGRTVNVKWYAKHESLLAITPDSLPNFYLVMTGPRSQAMTSRGEARPWLIESVFLFEAAPLVERLKARGVQIGVATSVTRAEWEAAEIYPQPRNPRYRLSEAQRAMLALFGRRTTDGGWRVRDSKPL